MASPKRKQLVPEGPPGVAPWLVTFSDCMTLLLCFFVLLTTFSSFDEQALHQIEGAIRTPSMDSIFPDRAVRDSHLKPPPREVDYTAAGSRVPDLQDPKLIRNPRDQRDSIDYDAFRDKQVFYIPVAKMFWGNGTRMRSQGTARLNLLADYLRAIRCRVVVAGDAAGAGRAGPSAAQALHQAWAIIEYFTARRGLAPERFSLSAAHGRAPDRFGGSPVMEITLLTRDVLK